MRGPDTREAHGPSVSALLLLVLLSVTRPAGAQEVGGVTAASEIELLRHWLERRVVQPDTPISISPRDRVYTADQVSNTIRVVYYLMRGGSLRESRARRSPGEAPVAP